MRHRAAASAAVVASVALAACGAGGQAAGDRPDGPGADVRWSRALGGAVVAGPVLAPGGLLLAAGNGGTLWGLDAATGSPRWRFAGGTAYGVDLSTSPLVRAGVALWPGPSDTLYAVGLDGRLRWHTVFDSQPLTPARGPGRTVYVQEMGGVLHALDVGADGTRERWRIQVGAGTSYGSPAVGPGGLVYTTVGRSLVAIRDAGGRARVAWRFTIAHDIEVSPAVLPDGTVVLGTNDAFQYGFSSSGKLRWRVRRDAWTYSSTGVGPGGIAAFGDHRGVVRTVDPRGRVLGVVRGLGQVWARPVIDRHGSVFFGTHSGYVQGFTRDGRELLRLKTGGSVESYPALGADGTLYIGSEDGRLYAIATGGA